MRLLKFLPVVVVAALLGFIAAEAIRDRPELPPAPTQTELLSGSSTSHRAILLDNLKSKFQVPVVDLSLPFESVQGLSDLLRTLQQAYEGRTPGIYLIESGDDSLTRRIQCLVISADHDPELHTMILSAETLPPMLRSHRSLRVSDIRLNALATEITFTGTDAEVTLTVDDLVSFGA